MPNNKSNKKNRRDGHASSKGVVATIPRGPREQNFTVDQTVYLGAVDISTDTYGGEYFTIGSLPNSTALLSTFDQYRIQQITFTMVPTVVVNTIQSYVVATGVNTLSRLPTLTTCIDNDDAGAPASENIVLDHETAVQHGSFNKTCARTFKPMIAVEVYQTGGFGGYSPMSNQWLDSASTAVQHYGLKWSMVHGANYSATQNYVLRYATFKVQLRKVF